MYRYNAPEKIGNTITYILLRSFYEFEDHTKNGRTYFDIAMKPESFKKVYDRAYCEQDNDEDNWKLEVTESGAADECYMMSLQLMSGQFCYTVVSDPAERELVWEEILDRDLKPVKIREID